MAIKNPAKIPELLNGQTEERILMTFDQNCEKHPDLDKFYG